MNNYLKIYHVVTYPDRRNSFSFCGKNAARSAARMANREGGKVTRINGKGWLDLVTREWSEMHSARWG